MHLRTYRKSACFPNALTLVFCPVCFLSLGISLHLISLSSQGAAEGGRSRARSIAPVLVLGTCMIAVLYGNATYYSDSL